MIFAESIEEKSSGAAVMNRMTQSSGLSCYFCRRKKIENDFVYHTGNTCRSSMAEALFRNLLKCSGKKRKK